MGGMQTFQWLASYPEFMFKAIPIVGTPRLTAQDMLLWQTELQAIEATLTCGANDEQAMKVVSGIHTLAKYTPSYRARITKLDNFQAFWAEQEKEYVNKKALDWAWQLKAVMNHNVYAEGTSTGQTTTKSPDQVAPNITTRYVLVVTAVQDQMVSPAPSRELAKLIQAETLELTGDCGHSANVCEAARLLEGVRRVLSK